MGAANSIRRWCVIAALASGACGRVDDEVAAASDGGSSTQPSADGSLPKPSADGQCDLSKPFGPLTPVPFETDFQVSVFPGPVLSRDELRIYAACEGTAQRGICVASRSDRAASFVGKRFVDVRWPARAERFIHGLAISADELEAYLIVSVEPGSGGPRGLRWARRNAVDQPFVVEPRFPAASFEGIETAEEFAHLSYDARYLYSIMYLPSEGTAERKQALVRRALLNGDWSEPQRMSGDADRAILPEDELTLFAGGGCRRRASRDDSFGPVERGCGPHFGGAVQVSPTWISPNGCRLYLTESSGNAARISVSVREAIGP